MNTKTKKKLAHLVLSYSFNYETNSTLEILEGLGVELSFDEANEITELIGDMIDRHHELSNGWEKAIKDKA